MAQSQDGRDTVQEWVHKQKERNQEKKRKIQRNQRKELGLGLTVTECSRDDEECSQECNRDGEECSQDDDGIEAGAKEAGMNG